MGNDVRIKVSKYASYLLRHNPQDLEMDDEGFVELERLVSKIRTRFPMIDRKLLNEIVEHSERKRFEIVGGKIRASYGHTIDVRMHLEEDTQVERLYHGTTLETAEDVLETGLRPMKRLWVHLSSTEDVAVQVGKRRTSSPVVLVVDCVVARRQGVKFYRVSDEVYLCRFVPARCIQRLGA